MFLSADQYPSRTNVPGRAFVEHALADHGRTLPLRQTALMAATAAQKGVDSTTVIFVESTFRRWMACSRSGLLRPVRQTRK